MVGVGVGEPGLAEAVEGLGDREAVWVKDAEGDVERVERVADADGVGERERVPVRLNDGDPVCDGDAL